MPKYDYRCPECGTEIEVEHSMTESPEFLCECEPFESNIQTVMKRVYGPISTHLRWKRKPGEVR